MILCIRSSNDKQPTFVANRNAEILKTSTLYEWHQIQGTKNPSELGTRGISFEELSNSDWMERSNWLKKLVVLVTDNLHPPANEIEVQTKSPVQTELFPNEMKALLSVQETSSNSEIATLAPFIDAEVVLRAKGRLRRFMMDFESKPPIF